MENDKAYERKVARREENEVAYCGWVNHFVNHM